MQAIRVKLPVSGRIVEVPAIAVDGTVIISEGIFLKIASIITEGWEESDRGRDPDHIIECIKSSVLKADIFTFAQKLPETIPKHNYPMEWDNFAVIRLNSYDDWWKNQITQVSRKNVRRAARRGVNTCLAEFNDEFVKGVVEIYNETPIRQGRRFWHYGKDLDTVRRENASYLDRSDFFGAYYDGELIGFAKIVYMGRVASIMQLLSKNSHYDKRPSNAVLAKAVERCAQRGISHFVYGNYVYSGNTESSLIEFKRRNGFEKLLVPRYYIPLTSWGKISLRLGLHRGIRALIPQKIQQSLLRLRSRWYERTILVQG